mgnify:CR=1 FL=1
MLAAYVYILSTYVVIEEGKCLIDFIKRRLERNYSQILTSAHVIKHVKELDIMRFIITGRNIDITEGLKSAVEEKLGKLDRFFAPETEVNVTLSVEKERQKIEVTIPVKGNIIRSEQVSSDMYVSIDLVEEVIERQLKKYKNKIVDKQQNAAAFTQEFVEKDYDDDEVKISEPRDSELSLWILKRHASRWSCSDITSMYS